MLTAFKPQEYYVLRNPTLHLEVLWRLLSSKNLQQFEAKLLKLLEDEFIEEALFIASPSLYERIQALKSGEKVSEKSQIIASIYKYLSRMATRCTPYGMFAGVSVGNFAESTQIELSPLYRRHIARLDMNYVSELIQYILSDPKISQSLRFYPNSSLYQLPNQYRYVESSITDKYKKYSVSSVEKTEYLDKIIAFAQKGKTMAEIAQCITSEEITLSEASDFVQQLAEAQLLVSEIEPQPTNPFFYESLIQKLSGITDAQPLQNLLSQIQNRLDLGRISIENYKQILNELSEIIPTASQDLVQIDTFFDTPQNQISSKSLALITRQIDELTPYLGISKPAADLENFRQRFYEKYQDQEIPLAVALDEEYGIGYGANSNAIGNLPLIENLSFETTQPPKSYTNDDFQALLLNKYSDAIRNRAKEIEISGKDLAQLPQKTFTDLPSSLYLFGNILNENTDNQSYNFCFGGISGPSATDLLTRFCYGNESLKNAIKTTTEAEERLFEGAIVAEIVHLPEARVGNILLRPTIHHHEIPYLGMPNVDNDFWIGIEDLLVSVTDSKKIVLRSQKHNKVVIPRLTSAHNHQFGLPIYRFLCDLQGENGVFRMGFDWGILQNQKFLPAVRYKNILLKRATWNLSADDLKTSLKEIIKRYQIERYVVIVDSDNELFLDLKHPICQQILTETIQKKKNVRLYQFIQTPEKCLIKTPNGSYTHEVVIPFVNTQPREFSIKSNLKSEIKRSFLVGSEWLYLKIYGGKVILDKFLKGQLKQFCEELISAGSVKQFFFIRYQDKEGFHLRLRFLLNQNGDIETSQKIFSFLNDFIDEGFFEKILVDTYQREIERYGEQTIQQSESIFFEESRLILDILAQIDNSTEDFRWLIACKSLDVLLDCFEFTTIEKREFLAKLSNAFIEEFGGGIELKKQLSQFFRERSPAVRMIMQDENSETEQISNSINRYREQIRPLVKTIKEKYPENTLKSIVSSHLHMFVNRIFIAEPRTHELVVYHHLHKYYDFLVATKQKSHFEQNPK